jgi:hypothetical protein
VLLEAPTRLGGILLTSWTFSSYCFFVKSRSTRSTAKLESILASTSTISGPLTFTIVVKIGRIRGLVLDLAVVDITTRSGLFPSTD